MWSEIAARIGTEVYKVRTRRAYLLCVRPVLRVDVNQGVDHLRSELKRRCRIRAAALQHAHERGAYYEIVCSHCGRAAHAAENSCHIYLHLNREKVRYDRTHSS
jgi:3-phosphoglycerate kinase